MYTCLVCCWMITRVSLRKIICFDPMKKRSMRSKPIPPVDQVMNNPRANNRFPLDGKKEIEDVSSRMLYDSKTVMDKIKEIMRQKKIDKLQRMKNHWKGLQ